MLFGKCQLHPNLAPPVMKYKLLWELPMTDERQADNWWVGLDTDGPTFKIHNRLVHR